MCRTKLRQADILGKAQPAYVARVITVKRSSINFVLYAPQECKSYVNYISQSFCNNACMESENYPLGYQGNNVKLLEINVCCLSTYFSVIPLAE